MPEKQGDRMPYADLGRVRLCYEVSGPKDGEPLLLIHGLGAQLIAWYPGFCRALEAAGFRLIRFDNRDVGLSSKCDDEPDYSLRDMACDVVGLLDALDLTSAHVVGQSMGGMIAQELAISEPERVRSLCSIYSAPGAEFLTDDEAFWSVLHRPTPQDRERAIGQWIETEKLSGLDGFDDAWLRAFATEIYDRNYCAQGLQRQARAMLNAPDRHAALARLTMPVAVIHGRDDQIISYRGGIATAGAVPGAELHLYAGMGHQVTPRLWDDFVRVITRNAERAAAYDAYDRSSPTAVTAGSRPGVHTADSDSDSVSDVGLHADSRVRSRTDSRTDSRTAGTSAASTT
ncbi:alpha/beta fold hydrolase [Streptomyces sp. NPDC020747]|uniref:alpha/beta fold hydrolase n=1 Tax=Streptomyces sp. NPDC020747 TaxID=3365086 RepID=UPI0037946A35